jgi:hypothetical protein
MAMRQQRQVLMLLLAAAGAACDARLAAERPAPPTAPGADLSTRAAAPAAQGATVTQALPSGAERSPPPTVPPLQHQGVRYQQDLSGQEPAGSAPGGTLAAFDVASGQRLWLLCPCKPPSSTWTAPWSTPWRLRSGADAPQSGAWPTWASPPVGGTRAFITRRTVGKGSEYLLMQHAGRSGRAGCGLYEAAWERYQHHYLAINGQHSDVYPGVLQGLQRCASGLRLACLTNKPNAFARPLLAPRGWTASSSMSSAATPSHARSPTRCRCWRPAWRWARDPARTLMVGDSQQRRRAPRAPPAARWCW